jgi:hypothetical protein
VHKHLCTRRSLLQLLGITIGAAAVIPAHAPHLDVAPSVDEPIVVNEPIEAEQPLSSPTRLERFIRSHGIKPAYLASESGYSRQHLLRLRFGRMRPSLTCIAALVIALRRLTNSRVTAEDLCEPCDIHLAWREARGQHFEDHEHEELRAAFGRRSLRAFLNGARS